MKAQDEPPQRTSRPAAPAGHAGPAALQRVPLAIGPIHVGGTAQLRARNLERSTGIVRLHLKFEGGNPTGTQKDRISSALVEDAASQGADAVTVATCGNYGASLALFARLRGLEAVLYVPERFHTRRTREMEEHGARVVRVPGEYEDAVEASREEARKRGLYDCNPGNGHFPIDIEAYGRIAREIVETLGSAPATVAVPVSNGTTLCGIHDGFVRLLAEGKTDRVPRMLASSSWKKNPIIASWQKELLLCVDLPREAVRETSVNEPLINWHAYDGQAALDAIRASSGWAEFVSDEKMLACARLVREEEGLHVLPASASALRALVKRHEREPLPEDDHVVVLTGRRQ